MKICRAHLIVLATVSFALGAAACGDSALPTSRVEHHGLVVEFKLACIQNDIALSGTILNSTSQLIRIESGSLPWQYDPLGSEFRAESAGKALTRNEAAALIGRTGPIKLATQERRSGSTPIGFMFPDMKTLLAKKQSVTVHWKYLVSVTPEDAMEGTIDIGQDPCVHH